MKKNSIFTLFVAAGLAGLTSCNDSATNTSSTDSPSTTTPAATPDNTNVNTNTSMSDYSAWADSLEMSSTSGYILNAKTGKPYKNLKVDRTTWQVMDETNEPVWHYVDNRNWWVYGLNDTDWTWDTIGSAKMQNDKLQYENDGKWSDYDESWTAADEKTTKSWKEKSNGVKIKVSRDGDVKVKDENGKVKYDGDDDKIKSKP